MGRYAQYRRRGGGGVGPTVGPPPLTITSVVATGGQTCTINFSGSITYDSSGNLTGFTINGNTVIGASANPTSLDLTMSDTVGVSNTWILSATPPEITQVISAPDTGLLI